MSSFFTSFLKSERLCISGHWSTRLLVYIKHSLQLSNLGVSWRAPFQTAPFSSRQFPARLWTLGRVEVWPVWPEVWTEKKLFNSVNFFRRFAPKIFGKGGSKMAKMVLFEGFFCTELLIFTIFAFHKFTNFGRRIPTQLDLAFFASFFLGSSWGQSGKWSDPPSDPPIFFQTAVWTPQG